MMHCITMFKTYFKIINEIIPQNNENQSFGVEQAYMVDPSVRVDCIYLVISNFDVVVSLGVLVSKMQCTELDQFLTM